MNKLVSIVITTKNEEKYLERTLHSIKNQTYKQIEIIIADSRSSDRTVQIAKKFTKKVFVKETNIPAGKNFGAQHASGDIIIFTDADVILPPYWVEKAVRQLNGYSLVIGTAKPIEKSLRASIIFDWGYFWLPKILLAIGSAGAPGSGTFCLRKSTFKRVDGFTESMNVYEDVDFCRKVKRIGRIKIDSNLVSLVSSRRLKKDGYFKWIAKYTSYGLYYFLFKKSLAKSFKPVR